MGDRAPVSVSDCEGGSRTGHCSAGSLHSGLPRCNPVSHCSFCFTDGASGDPLLSYVVRVDGMSRAVCLGGISLWPDLGLVEFADPFDF